jgi:hypothetical protein
MVNARDTSSFAQLHEAYPGVGFLILFSKAFLEMKQTLLML